VSFDDISAHDPAGTVSAVVRTLWSRVPVRWPAVGPAILVLTEESVLLLDSPLEVFVLVLFQKCGSVCTEVVPVRLPIRVEALAQDDSVIPSTERAGVDGDRLQVDIRVFTRCAVYVFGGTAIKVPFAHVLEKIWYFIDSLWKIISCCSLFIHERMILSRIEQSFIDGACMLGAAQRLRQPSRDRRQTLCRPLSFSLSHCSRYGPAEAWPRSL